ncbi:MAG: S-layer family protein [Nostoc sp. JL33]|uniref:beta strand repeat-containing protein n=1 Tax=Nostoc sp. JL33 TaxID=2815396 RepID=UPI0025E0563C|nr:S-layer family protein [Nostoc sp. JL33]MBN3871545.1 S-layer family protein [Nostoc sp. JL33]
MSAITQDLQRWCSSLVVGGVLIASLQEHVFAQITPDGTLPNNSVVTSDGNTLNITGGTQAGSNLFHSFGEFSVPNGGVASFNNALDIQNIISRVTGGLASNIDGLIRANGTANLFLINPSGIVFGKNAQLNIGGSFVATTANAIQFGNQGFWSISNPETSPSLLTVNPSAFFFNQITTGSIQNGSTAPAGSKLLTYDSGLGDNLYLFFRDPFPLFGLRVPDGRSLLFLGGNVSLDGGNLNALSGRVELGGVAEAGTVGLNVDGKNLHLSFPNGMAQADVTLTNGSQVEANDIQVQARHLTLTNGSEILATAQGAEPGGNLTVTATESVELSGSSEFGFGSRLSASSKDNGGNLTISTRKLIVRDGAEVSTDNSGKGTGGNLTVAASNSVEVSGSSWTKSNLSATSEGAEGNLTIATGRLLVRNGASVLVTSGFDSTNVEPDLTNRGGNLTVSASDFVELSGSETDRFGSPASLYSSNYGNGAKGNLTITTPKLIVQDGSSINTNVGLGAGKGGNITVNASDFVELIGTSKGSYPYSGSLISQTGQYLSGLSTDGYSIGDAGDITITTGRLLVQDGARVSASTFGLGSGGKLTISASDSVQLVGTSADGQTMSSLLTESTIAPGSLPGRGVATGNAGNIEINTKRLQVLDGAQVSASTLGPGKGGNLIVAAADSIELIGTSADGQTRSSLLTQSSPPVGDPRFGVIIKPGNGGHLNIRSRQLKVQDRAQVSTSSLGSGDAGNLDIATSYSISLDNQAVLSAESAFGKGGSIQLQARDLLVSRRNSLISAVSGNLSSNGFDGNININTKFLIAVPAENSDIVATGFGRSPGSNIQVNAQGIFGTQFRQQLTSESDIVATGQVTLNTPDIDPNSGLLELPTIPVATEVTQGCYSAGYAQNRFVISGRGGLPLNPYNFLSPNAVLADWVTLNPSTREGKSPPVSIKPTTATPKPIVEATGWVMNAKGELELTANAPSTPHGSWQNAVSCRAAS